MNPELDQDDINIEEFLYPCLNDKNEKLKVELNAVEIFNKTLVNVFEYYRYYEQAVQNDTFDEPNPLPDQNPNNNTAFFAMNSLYAIIPVFSDAKSCEELERIINQNIGQITTYFNSVDGATNIGVLGGKPSITKLQTSFNEFLVVLNTICDVYNLA
jgi:hypothetical protein